MDTSASHENICKDSIHLSLCKPYHIAGTRIIYDRKFLLLMRNSPLAKTPPAKLATIPDIINEDIGGSPPEKSMSPGPAVSNREGVNVSL